MVLKKGLLFDRRYLLINSLGQGASAQVWLAQDTMANNLKVAIKILSSYEGIDTIGVQNFQKEFTYVYNIQHQNLLTPTNYAICDGTPYLVLPYCENGSATSMLGRADESDVIKFLHDVSAALECLHAHNIVHQDIKPDNVLLDDDCNFLVTDFGISTQSRRSSSETPGNYGGTRAYMGPERFEKDATAINMNDIWALGATAYEMFSGNPPFGDYGGMVQTMGEPIPDLPDNLQPELRKIILGCLEPEPWNRPSAEEIRKKTQRYIETGSWKEKNEKKYLYISATAVVILLLLAGLGYWDYNRTKIYYYKDYAEFWGIPEGIGRLSGSEMSHRQQSYRMEYCQNKLRRMSLVNPEDNLTKHKDTETMLSRYTDVHYYYTDDGKIDYKAIYDQAGKLLYKMDYDESLKTVTFRQNDEYGTEMNLRANTTDRFNQGTQLFEDKSRISRFLLNYDGDGLLTQQLYVGLQNVPAGDQDNIYGLRFKYDSKGRKIEEQFMGADGGPTSNGIGLSITRYKYNENDDWCEVRYLNLEGNPSHDGNNCSLVKIESDEWGNRIKETYHTIDGDNSIRTDMGVSGFTYIYDDNGHCTSITTIGLDGNPMSCRYGYAIIEYAYDENGYESQNTFLDINRNPASLTSDGDSYTRVDIKNNEKGLPVEYVFYDEDGKEQELSHGYSVLSIKYDSIGNRTELSYLNAKHQLALYDGLYAKICFYNDEFSHVTSIKYFDDKNKPSINEEGISQISSDYNRQGSIVKMSFYGIDGKLSVGSGFFASQTWDYDELGNEKTIQFYDVNEKLTNNSGGGARREFIYDNKTNFVLQTKDYNAQGTLISTLYNDYDKRGNIIKQYIFNSSGQLQKGTAVEHSEFDDNNRPIAVWYSNQKDQPINKPGTKISKVLNKYDSRGNIIEKTFWGADGKPSVDEQGAFKREQRFNDLGLPVYERNLDANGKPLIGKDVNPEGKCEYDKQGNMTKIECYDGYGKPRLSSDGFFKATSKFNHQNKLIEHSFYDVKGNLVMSRSQQYARKTTQYDKSGLELEINYFNEKDNLFRIDTYKYNSKNRMTEQLILNEKKQEEDKYWGYSKMTIEYNENGLIPIQRVFYNKNHQKLGYQNYNGVTKSWGNVVGINQNNSFNIVGNRWKQAIMEFAAMCPVDAGNGVRITSITLEGDIVTCNIRLTTIDTDAMEEEDLQNMRNMIPTITKQMKKMIGIPTEVKLILIVQDKNGKRV